MDRSVIIARASTGKQVIHGDTLDDQIAQCSRYAESQGWGKPVKIFPLVESGRKAEREYFEEVIKYCADKSNRVDWLVFKNFSRFTRGGEKAYLDLKEKLGKSGVKVQDILGTVKEDVNTFEDLGFEYEFSIIKPSEAEELRQAREAKEEAGKALRRMIRAEIQYTQKGFWRGPPPFGYQNVRKETFDRGERVVLEEKEHESYFIKQMFELRASGLYTDKEVVEKINLLGFRTRKFKRREKITMRVIGYGGSNILSVKQLQRFIKRPIFSGIVCEKWTHFKPVKAQFDGFISPQLFNKANRGKKSITIIGDQVDLTRGKEKLGKRSKYNPMYPFKNVILCPSCDNTLMGSASTGKSGKKFPLYHCGRGHKQWSKPVADLNQVVYGFINDLEFDEGFIRLFEESFKEVYESKRGDAITKSRKAEEYVSSLLREQEQLSETIKVVSSSKLRKKYEQDFEKLDDKITKARKKRAEDERKEVGIKLKLKYAVYLMEHLEEVLIDRDNIVAQQQLFSLVFTELPTYDELVNGTPKLEPLFKLNDKSDLSKSQIVSREGLEPPTSKV
jgi:site-specific DNA recombinase